MNSAAPFDFTALLTSPARHLMDIIAANNGEARIVGGAVRDIVLGRPAGDIDLAVNLAPPRVIEILSAAGIKTVPTGLAHGTLTAVIDRVGYEITTLRRDVTTDGRHAEVAFTDDWQSDAARRDFTFNALYLARDGGLTDFFGGVDDARAGRVRFIGNAATRIEEDVLRILRFFRFHAWFGQGAPDSEAVAACTRLAPLMPRLSAERVMRETLKLLAAPDPVAAWELMDDCGITAQFLPESKNLTQLEKLVTREGARNLPPQPLRRLAALLPPEPATIDAVGLRLKLSLRDAADLRSLSALPQLLQHHLASLTLRKIIYTEGMSAVAAALPLLDITDSDYRSASSIIAAWENPTLPIRGEDIVRMGIAAGPRVGAVLRHVEDWWRDGDFRADRATCLELAREYGKNH